MTTARHQRKAGRRRLLVPFWLGLIISIASAGGCEAQTAATERIVLDRHTGLALSGFDPVAYFTDAKPVIGLPQFEYPLGGGIWRFRNEGNRAAFIEHPEIYMPRFGGYDPVAIARGVALAGHPEVWLIWTERLYLFRTTDARAAFAAHAQQAIAEAEMHWPAVMKALVP